MEPIRCLIVDDEPLALDLVRSYVERTPFLELIGKASSAREALEVLQAQRVELLILDIQMPGLNGTDLVRTLKNGPKVIFSTAYESFALEGYRLDALDYLLKPYVYPEFLRAVQKANALLRPPQVPTEAVADEPSFFFVKSDTRLVRIDIERILYIEGMKDYAQIFLKGEPKPVLALTTLKALQEKLPAATFLRPHRSFLVNLRHVQSLDKNDLLVAGTPIPIAERSRGAIEESLQAFRA